MLTSDHLRILVTNFDLTKVDMNVALIGPSSKSIRAMGDKITSKRIANVNIIPGFDDVITDEAHCLKIANQIGRTPTGQP